MVYRSSCESLALLKWKHTKNLVWYSPKRSKAVTVLIQRNLPPPGGRYPSLYRGKHLNLLCKCTHIPNIHSWDIPLLVADECSYQNWISHDETSEYCLMISIYYSQKQTLLGIWLTPEAIHIHLVRVYVEWWPHLIRVGLGKGSPSPFIDWHAYEHASNLCMHGDCIIPKQSTMLGSTYSTYSTEAEATYSRTKESEKLPWMSFLTTEN